MTVTVQSHKARKDRTPAPANQVTDPPGLSNTFIHTTREQATDEITDFWENHDNEAD